MMTKKTKPRKAISKPIGNDAAFLSGFESQKMPKKAAKSKTKKSAKK